MIPLLAAASAVAVGVVIWVLLQRSRRGGHTPLPAPVSAPVRGRFGTRIGHVFGRHLDSTLWEELAEALIEADLGVASAARVIDQARAVRPATGEEARLAVRTALVDAFGDLDRSIGSAGSPAVIVVVGVNGSGKTTTIAKLASWFVAAQHRVLVAAADTFRAAAAEQVEQWGKTIGFEVVRGGAGADPASVAFDALGAARARRCDVLIVDTAGRLHSNQNLMQELSKIVRVLERESGTIDEILLVIDGSGGQNSLVQAAAFTAAVGVTGIAVTKLDGSARGGVVLAIEHDLGIPVKLIGVGERPDDMLHFSPEHFVDELLGEA